MRNSFISAAVLALASSVFAQTEGYNAITSPVEHEIVPAGRPYEIKWLVGRFSEGTGSIQLLQGATPSTLQLGQVINGAVNNAAGQYTWNVPADIPRFHTYGLKFTSNVNSSIFQYSFPFRISESSESRGGTFTIRLGLGSAYVPPIPSPTTTTTTATTATTTTTTTTTTTPCTSSTLTTNSSTTRTYNTTSSFITPSPRSNLTHSTASTSPTGPAANGASPTPPSQFYVGAASSNVVRGGMALIGGIVVAFAL